MTDDETGRLFVSVLLPDSAVEALAALPRPEIEGVRWTEPENWHVTLRFLGNAPVPEATAAFETITAPGATARLGPRVWRLGQSVAMVPVVGLDDLASAVAAATAGVGEAPERRRFVGHVTVARTRARMPTAALGSEVAAEFDVEQIHLMRSHLDHVGPRYEIVSGRHLSQKLD